MRTKEIRSAHRAIPLTLLVGSGALLLYLALALAESLLDAGPLGSACIEECAKAACLMVAGIVAWRGAGTVGSADGRRKRASAAVRGLGAGLTLVVAFAAIENLAYFLAFPAGDVFGRLLWSEPVHISSALAEALGVAAALGARGRRSPVSFLARWLPWFLGGLAWHLGANALAGGLAGGAFPGGPPLLWGSFANLVLISLLARLYVRRVIIGGFLYGWS